MNAAGAVQLAVYVAAILFGVFAIVRWRQQGASVLAGLGLKVDRRSPLDLAVGMSITTIIMIGIFIVEWGLGGIQTAGASFDYAAAFRFGLILMVMAVLDEVTMRGMLVSGLSLALGGRQLAAVLIGGVLFGATHMFFGGASALSVTSNSLGGVMYGLAFILTRRIWMGVGLHFAWNFVQGPILGFTVSAHALGGGLFNIVDLGPAWLTGVPYGPEGGLVGVVSRFVVIGAVLAWAGWAGQAPDDRFSATRGGAFLRQPNGQEG